MTEAEAIARAPACAAAPRFRPRDWRRRLETFDADAKAARPWDDVLADLKARRPPACWQRREIERRTADPSCCRPTFAHCPAGKVAVGGDLSSMGQDPGQSSRISRAMMLLLLRGVYSYVTTTQPQMPESLWKPCA
jgi:hypothetical protein